MKRRHLAFLATLLVILGTLALSARASDSSNLMAALKAMPAQSDKFRSMMSNLNASQFHLVNAAGMMSSDFKTSLKKDGPDIADLRDTLTHTTVTGADGVVVPLRKVLMGKNVTIDQVIGIFVGGDGQITLFYQ